MKLADQMRRWFSRTPDAAQEAPRGDGSTIQDMSESRVFNYPESRLATEVPPTAAPPAVAEQLDDSDERVRLPVLGLRTPAQHQNVLYTVGAFAVVVLVALAAFAVRSASQASVQASAAGRALVESQRLAVSAGLAVAGDAAAFGQLNASVGALGANVRALRQGNAEMGVEPVAETEVEGLAGLDEWVGKAERNARAIINQQQLLTTSSQGLRNISRQSADMLETAESVVAMKLQQNAPAQEVSAAAQLVMLTQRLAKSASEVMGMGGMSPEAVFAIGRDLNTFRELASGLLEGSPELKLNAARDPALRERLGALVKQYESMRGATTGVLGNLQGLLGAREAQASIVADTEPMRARLEGVQTALAQRTGLTAGPLAAGAMAAIVALLCGLGLSRVSIAASRRREELAERERRKAESDEQEQRRVNDANQAAILRLMNELQTVAEGDLTQQATVTEDITGAIADSINYTVEELRLLVGSVQNTAQKVAQTTAQVDNTSTELLAASGEQLREIRETGQSVLDMASRINEVSGQAQESAAVARQSLQAATSGLKAVQDTIGGMNVIRDQIQDTSKRIKRLGESSQEIGEITELISDITEQTNVLALNAAIQAASAGEAGRGFSVVAEEVQRLAERSGDATRQIAALVKTIQTDTQDAVAAMERSTQGVVEGAKLSDSAGTALSEIDRVSRRLAELIEDISQATYREASSANEVAENIQHIFAVTEQTSDGTRSTANQVRELSRMAEELRQSVARFRIG
jgi:twitching motility protein PilJ